MAFRSDPPAIDDYALTWDETGHESDPAARLLAHIRIAGLDMHLEAWAITYDEDGMQEVTAATMRSDAFGTICDIMDTAFETTTINGREYVLIATPYGR